ncbi:MAG: SGNH/GDSL hydrolase family protein, partial [Flavobacteriales bacterium]|nr:SGNH/GDSL hydrolase family protein [Flavobacteriales bacterium]
TIVLAAGSFVAALNQTDGLFDPNSIPIGRYIMRSVLLIACLFLSWVGISGLFRLTKSKIIVGVLLSLTSLFSLLLILEIALSVTAISSGGGQVLVSRNWFNFYWQENQFGYRDGEPAELDRPDKKNILIVGDSYVAGHGLKKEGERFSNLLRNKLSSCYDVFNLGVCGANTIDQIAFLEDYPIKPDLVVLVHGKNDIQEVRSSAEIQRILDIDPESVSDYPKQKWKSSYLMKNSFLVNLLEFLVHKVAEKDYMSKISSRHSKLEDILATDAGKLWYYSYYLNQELMETHLNMLDSIADWTERNNSEYLLMLFPATTDQILSDTDRIINQPIQQHAEKNQVSVLNLTAVLEEMSESDRVVSKLDPHPSIKLNKAVADTLSKRILRIMKTGNSCKPSL